MSNYRTDIVSRMTEVMAELPEKCLPFADILVEALELHNKKSRDYGDGEDPYKNVRASEDFGVPAWLGVGMRMGDKVRRLQTFAKTGKLANEGVEDSFIDLVVYAAIGLLLFREKSMCKVQEAVSENHRLL